MELAPCSKIPAVVLIGSYFSRAINNQSERLHGHVYHAISTKFSLLRSTFLVKDKNGREKRNKRICFSFLRASKKFYVNWREISYPSLANIWLKWMAMFIKEARHIRSMAPSSQWSKMAPLMTLINRFRSAGLHGKSVDIHWKSDVISWK